MKRSDKIEREKEEKYLFNNSLLAYFKNFQEVLLDLEDFEIFLTLVSGFTW